MRPACARCSIRSTSPRPHAALARFDLADKLFDARRPAVRRRAPARRPGARAARRRPRCGWSTSRCRRSTRRARRRRSTTLTATARERGVTLVDDAAPGRRGAGALPAHRRPARRRRCAFDLPARRGHARAAARAVRAARGRAARRRAPRRRPAATLPRPRGRCTAAERMRAAAAMPAAVAAPRLRDPPGSAACSGRCAALVLLWPLLVATEFKPWMLFDAAQPAADAGASSRLRAAGASTPSSCGWSRARPGAPWPSPPPA